MVSQNSGRPGLSGVERLWARLMAIPFLGLPFATPRLLLRRDLGGLKRLIVVDIKRTYHFLEHQPVIGPVINRKMVAARYYYRRNKSGGPGSLWRALLRDLLRYGQQLPRRPITVLVLYIRVPRVFFRRSAQVLGRLYRTVVPVSHTQTKMRQWDRSGYFYSYEFDAAVTKYSDIKSVILHHERSKPLVSSFYRGLYDLRSGLVLRMAWMMEEVLEHHAKSFGIGLAEFAPYQLLRASYADLDPRTQSIAYLRAAIERDPCLAEAHCHLGIIYRETGHDKEALACFHAVLDLAPTILCGKFEIPLPARAQYESGLVLRRLGRRDEALACFRKAVEALGCFANAHRNPGTDCFADAHRALAEELRYAKRYAEAAEQFHRAMYCREIPPILPALPVRLAAAPAEDATTFFGPEIEPLDTEHPVQLPPHHDLGILLYRYFGSSDFSAYVMESFLVMERLVILGCCRAIMWYFSRILIGIRSCAAWTITGIASAEKGRSFFSRSGLTRS